MKTVLIVLMLLFLYTASSQNKIRYTYDAAGNRIKREIVLNSTKNLSTSSVDEDHFVYEQLSTRRIKIYPNPTKGSLKIEIEPSDGITSCRIVVSSLNNGKIITMLNADLPVTNIDISNQPIGFYVMKITIDGEITTWKIIKE